MINMHTININEVFYSNYKNVVFKEHSCLLQRSQVIKYMSFFSHVMFCAYCSIQNIHMNTMHINNVYDTHT